MFQIVKPQEAALTARKDLQKAMKALADAQVAIAASLEIIDMFEANFRGGHYQEKPLQSPVFTSSSVLPVETNDA